MSSFFDSETMFRILVVFSILYALWVMYYTLFGDRKRNKKESGGDFPPSAQTGNRGEKPDGKK
jgi:hypothetical protein